SKLSLLRHLGIDCGQNPAPIPALQLKDESDLLLVLNSCPYLRDLPLPHLRFSNACMEELTKKLRAKAKKLPQVFIYMHNAGFKINNKAARGFENLVLAKNQLVPVPN